MFADYTRPATFHFDRFFPSVLWVPLLDPASCGLRGFSPGTPVFPSAQKPTFPNSYSIPGCMDISERVLVTPWCSVSKQITYLHTVFT